MTVKKCKMLVAKRERIYYSLKWEGILQLRP